ncbi:DUF805 domain-containing protein [Xanthobacter dioxanivorans]|uniref:DUF805 domain-containing protein n=1 Tax=Xanthobacter dioxanivorans TaxID=2528964 RepID=A0A974PQB8_9HYPH|nr:DUF805 domain-containing protein [Xanthobacter dioxanivorans]
MNLNDAVKTCFKKYAEFSGRAKRSEFWWYSLFVVLLSFAYTWKSDNLFFYYVGNAFSLLTIIPSWAVGSRRLHDVGRSGWWQLLALAIIGLLPLLYWWVQPSQPGPNRYGEEPEADKGTPPASPIPQAAHPQPSLQSAPVTPSAPVAGPPTETREAPRGMLHWTQQNRDQ